MEAYNQVHAPQEVDEATAMAKRGYDEAPIRQKIAKSTGGGKAADRATALEKKPTYGNDKAGKQRSDYARKQRGDFRKTTSSSPGLHGYGHKSDDPKVKAKQAARGAQRGALTPNEKKELNREQYERLEATGLFTAEEIERILDIMCEDQFDEADSIDAMRERAAKRRQQRYGKQGGGGRDDFRPYTKADYERGEANDPRKKK